MKKMRCDFYSCPSKARFIIRYTHKDKDAATIVCRRHMKMHGPQLKKSKLNKIKSVSHRI